MAHAISLTDGTTTISLSTSGVFLTKYSPQPPSIRANTTQSAAGDDVTDPIYENVTETIELMPYAANTAALQAVVNGIERMVDYARRRQRTRAGAKVYLQLQVDGEANAHRCEVLYARFEPGEDALAIWGNYQFLARLHITRRFYWEGPETELQLSTSNQSAATGGRTIKNHDDSGTGDDNWVQVAAAQVTGVLPTPVKLTLQNTTGGSVGYRSFYLAVNAYSDPANFTHILEGEARKTGYGTVTSDANSSNGNYNAYSFNSSGEIQWDLSATVMQDTMGRWFRLLARCFSWSGTSVYVKPALKESNGLIAIWEGDEVKLGTSGSQIIDLGAVPLPPGGYLTTWDAMVLSLELRSTGAATFNVDFIQLTPLDSYQNFTQRGNLIVNNGTITVDNIEGIIHAGGSPIYSPKTDGLMLYPGQLQRIICLQDTGSASNIAQTFSVRAYIRPRRLTV